MSFAKFLKQPFYKTSPDVCFWQQWEVLRYGTKEKEKLRNFFLKGLVGLNIPNKCCNELLKLIKADLNF